ncbi:SPFH domain-containing protein [Streptomyces sp. S.PNR 29]|uniref:SPFH domain-containing protein n=1 Tax=Streptomyces sp. S.PNR 29 TaxID=2973805 RepID=UPI0025B0C2C9|nr:SPFH domain-containing protein [Streptomyces sp. S.PNR 29]MDN0199558.1 SPFH domain-containing protein [Streptomyces sp. S.PNR 29]
MMIPLLAVLAALLGAAGWVGWAGRVAVPADHVGIVTRRLGPAHPNPAFKQVNPATARGVLARTLLPGGFHWLTPLMYSVDFVPRVHVPAGMIGLVTAKEGRTRTDGRTLGRHVDCDGFQDGQAFLLGGGEQGVQVATLTGGQAYYINTRLFDVEMVPRTYVPPGTVGLVQAKAGAVRPADQRFGRHVECDSFQDGQAFLDGGGEQGRQLAVLGGGAYYDINPELFQVITTDNVSASRDGLTEAHLQEISLEEGYTGVVVTLDGAEPRQDADGTVGPRVEGHRSFRLPWVFLAGGGWRGVQEETLGEGTTYALNPWFVRVLPIPTRMLFLKWADKQESESDNYDVALGKIVVNVQGFDLEVALSQNLQIPRDVAPRLVSEFGGVPTSGLGGLVDDPAPVQRFVRNVLGETVSGYFSEIATTSSVLDFLGRYEDVRKDLTDKVTHALEKLGVRTLNTSLGRFTPTDPSLPEALKKRFDAENDLDNLRVGVEQAQLRDLIDELEAQSEYRRVALELEKEVRLLGPENVAMIRIVREFANFDVPDYIGGGDISAYVQALPMTAVQDLLARLRELRQDQQAIAGVPRQELTKESETQAED